VIIDLFSRRVVGYHISYRNSVQLIKTTFRKAFQSRQPSAGLIFHSDRGGNYRSNSMHDLLKSSGVVQSFSRAYIPYDNSVMESFFSNMKREELYRTKYRSEKELRTAVADYIEFYNEKRPHKTLHYKTPAQHENEYYGKQAFERLD